MPHLTGQSRQQISLLPESLDELVGADPPVRVIDAFVDTLDVAALGFRRAVARDTGRKPYHPCDLLKLYVYGYLNRVSTSRRLERECRRVVEVMWLLGRPDVPPLSVARSRARRQSRCGRWACPSCGRTAATRLFIGN